MRSARSIFVASVVLGLLAAGPAPAIPTEVIHEDHLSHCDKLVVPPTVDELGLGPPLGGPFPPDEEIEAVDLGFDFPACPLFDGPAPNVRVSMTNRTPFDFQEVWYVADLAETFLRNWDGFVDDAVSALCVPIPGHECFAFRIDSPISDPGGRNHPLRFESLGVNDVFESGETWEFIIDDYFNGAGLPASALDSIGVGSASAGGPPSSGSIIAIIPEPGTLALVGFGVVALGIVGRSRLRKK